MMSNVRFGLKAERARLASHRRVREMSGFDSEITSCDRVVATVALLLNNS